MEELKDVKDLGEIAATGGPIDPKAEIALARYESDVVQRKLTGYRSGVAGMKARRGAKLAEYVSSLEDNLARPQVIEGMTVEQRMKALLIFRQSLKDDLEYIDDYLKREGNANLSFHDRRTIVLTDSKAPLKIGDYEITPEGREKIRAMFEGLILRAKSIPMESKKKIKKANGSNA